MRIIAIVRILFVASFVATSCSAFPPIYRDDGPPIKLPPSEIAQIERIIAGRADIHKPLASITIHDDGYAECYSAVYRVGKDVFVTSFDLVRRNGKWSLDEKSLRQVKGEQPK
jgi:hypothetical protein